MIKIIDGKRYNTETAKRVYEWCNSYLPGDFKHRSKDLYRTQKGAWFLLHYGGALTDMAISVQGGTGGSSDIEPISDGDAFGFLQAHSDDSDAAKALETYFGDRIEDA